MKLAIRIGAGLAVVVLLLTILAAVLVKIHVHRIWGGYVQHVDHREFEVEAALTAITNVSVLSTDGTSMLSPQMVVFDADGIISVSAEGEVPAGARTIDGSGRYLIPGLVDSHVHLRRQPNDLLLYLANGVTQIRDLSGSPMILGLRDEIVAGRAGPRIEACSPIISTNPGVYGWFREQTEPRLNVTNPRTAAKVVRKLKKQGYDELKTYADIDLEVYRAINAAAKEQGIHTVGHLPFTFSLDELGTTDQQELAHIEEVVKKLQDAFRDASDAPYAEAFPAFVEANADRIIDDILANDMTVNSTLWLMEVVGKQVFTLEEQLGMLPIEYANPAMMEGSPYIRAVGWLPGQNAFERTQETDTAERARIEASWEARAEAHRIMARRMIERGVRITAGTDATSQLVIPGFSLHEELQSLTRNGMTPAESLRSATATPAMIMDNNAGKIEPGRRADLLLLSANPLEDIRSTTEIEAVVANGRVYDRASLDLMLTRIKEANAVSRKFDLARYRQE